MSGALGLDRIRFGYDGTPVVRGVSLEVAAGEILCLLGPSGCGKTTCLRIAAGLEMPDAGEVRIDGRTVAGPGLHVPPEQRRIGLVLQDFALFPHLDVLDNVAFGAVGRSRVARRAAAAGLLAQVGLAEFARAWPHQLSGGQQQRVALARALAPEPVAMLMDEPFSGLDVTLRATIREAAIEVLKARGVPTLIVTHDPEEALAIADRIAIMRAGRIVQEGTPAEIFNAPANAFVMRFFGAPNRLDGKVEGGAVATPFGPLPAPGLAEGSAVEILFRGNALRIADAGDAVPVRVESVRLAGSLQRIRVRPIAGGPALVVEGSSTEAVAPGATLCICADIEAFRAFPQAQPLVEEPC